MAFYGQTMFPRCTDFRHMQIVLHQRVMKERSRQSWPVSFLLMSFLRYPIKPETKNGLSFCSQACVHVIDMIPPNHYGPKLTLEDIPLIFNHFEFI